MAAGVFISFRPEDSAWAARIRDRLQGSVGRDDLGRGADFAKALKTGAAEIEALVLIIGRHWVAGMLDDPSDPVRLEIEAALNLKIRVIPVLVDGASMPAANALPESLKALALLRAIELSSGRFDSDIERLLEALRNRTGRGIQIKGSTFTANQIADKIVIRELSQLIESAKEKPTNKKPTNKGVKKRTTGRIVPKEGAAKKVVAKKSAAKRSAVRRPAAKKPAARKAARPTPEERNAARARLRIVNQDLSVDEMKDLASARRAGVLPAAGRPGVRAEAVQSAEVVDEIVECSVFGPPSAPPGKTILIQVFLHLANQAERASFLATTMDASAKLKGAKSLDLPIKRGARVEIAFSANGLTVDEPVQSVVWRGEPTFCQFRATIPKGTNGDSFLPVVRVSIDGKLIGRIVFSLSSDDTASQPTSEPLGDHAGPYRYAFVSYASKDREEVLKRVQMLEILKTKFFQDILSLDPATAGRKGSTRISSAATCSCCFGHKRQKTRNGSSRKPNTRSRIGRKIQVASPISCRSYWSKTCSPRRTCPPFISTTGFPI
jgi:hypothetical protein